MCHKPCYELMHSVLLSEEIKAILMSFLYLKHNNGRQAAKIITFIIISLFALIKVYKKEPKGNYPCK